MTKTGIALSVAVLASCDGNPNSADSASQTTAPTLREYAGMNFEGLTGDTVPATVIGQNTGTISGKIVLNRVNPISGQVDAKFSAILNGTDWTANSWGSMSLDHAYNSKFFVDASHAKGLKFLARSGKTRNLVVTPWGMAYTKEQDAAGAQLAWTITTRKTLDTFELPFEELNYRSWLYDAGQPCAKDSVKFCPDIKAKILSKLSSLTFTIIAAGSTSVNDTAWVEFDDVKLYY